MGKEKAKKQKYYLTEKGRKRIGKFPQFAQVEELIFSLTGSGASIGEESYWQKTGVTLKQLEAWNPFDKEAGLFGVPDWEKYDKAVGNLKKRISKSIKDGYIAEQPEGGIKTGINSLIETKKFGEANTLKKQLKKEGVKTYITETQQETYSVNLVSQSDKGKAEEITLKRVLKYKRPKLSSGFFPRITPKTPRLRR